jgi:hypothetical protein
VRFVDRTAVAEPPSLADQGSDGADELIEARTYYESRAAPTKSYSFKAYKADDVRQALEILFKGKCAYCETPYRASQPVDVEHYRPKGQVEDDPLHAGYWWLAMRWDNLLPSCIDCNRRRRQSTAAPGMSLAELEAALHEGRSNSSGKKDAFPTRNGTWARTEADDIAAEQPLLIDPARVDPAAHIAWPVDAEISVAVPVLDAAGHPSPEGVASIHVYGLNRQGLTQERTYLLLELRRQEAAIDDLLDIAATAPQPQADRILTAVRGMIDGMVSLTAPNQRYSTVAGAFVALLRDKLAAQSL